MFELGSKAREVLKKEIIPQYPIFLLKEIKHRKKIVDWNFKMNKRWAMKQKRNTHNSEELESLETASFCYGKAIPLLPLQTPRSTV